MIYPIRLYWCRQCIQAAKSELMSESPIRERETYSGEAFVCGDQMLVGDKVRYGDEPCCKSAEYVLESSSKIQVKIVI